MCSTLHAADQHCQQGSPCLQCFADGFPVCICLHENISRIYMLHEACNESALAIYYLLCTSPCEDGVPTCTTTATSPFASHFRLSKKCSIPSTSVSEWTGLCASSTLRHCLLNDALGISLLYIARLTSCCLDAWHAAGHAVGRDELSRPRGGA